jgi:dTDP-4-dehydrorhamnose reductase
VQPDVVVNAAAYTAVDLAEKEPDNAFAINAEGAENAARAAATMGVPIIHISTDYVFDGTKSAPYTESDPVAPQSVYGASKLLGERLVAQAHPQHIILRTAWVYAPRGKNFVRTMLRLAKANPMVRVVDDQHGNPTSADAIANGILAIANAVHAPKQSRHWGLFHMTGGGETTWCGLARTVFAQSRTLGGPSTEVTAIATSDYPTPAKRPQNSRLNCAKLREAYGVQLPPWQDSLSQCMKTIAANNWDVT